MNERIKQSELAKVLGVSRAYITQLKKSGKLTVDQDGLVDLDRARQEIEAFKEVNRDPQREAVAKRKGKQEIHDLQSEIESQIASAQGKVDALVPKGLKYIDLDEINNLTTEQIGKKTRETQLIQETFDAMIRELQYYEKLGTLIAVDDVIEANRKISAAVRSRLLSLPGRMAPQMEGLSVSQRQHKLEDAINEILKELNTLDKCEEKASA